MNNTQAEEAARNHIAPWVFPHGTHLCVQIREHGMSSAPESLPVAHSVGDGGGADHDPDF